MFFRVRCKSIVEANQHPGKILFELKTEGVVHLQVVRVQQVFRKGVRFFGNASGPEQACVIPSLPPIFRKLGG